MFVFRGIGGGLVVAADVGPAVTCFDGDWFCLEGFVGFVTDCSVGRGGGCLFEFDVECE